MRSKPIVRFVINIGDDGITPMLNVKHKTKIIPNPNDLIYVNDKGPYYIVEKVVHYLGPRHLIWVMINPVESSELEKK